MASGAFEAPFIATAFDQETWYPFWAFFIGGYGITT